ncbi:hypothetical protein SUGI_0406280 [Cryptomeria japonica]|nr:hypothetical protein SUGI_0406280 [Cryptomeria japonica]
MDLYVVDSMVVFKFEDYLGQDRCVLTINCSFDTVFQVDSITFLMQNQVRYYLELRVWMTLFRFLYWVLGGNNSIQRDVTQWNWVCKLKETDILCEILKALPDIA